MDRKISLVGAGNIGGELANIILNKGMADIAMVDISAGVAKGKALDLKQSYSINGPDCNIVAGDDYSLITASDIVIVTAGFPRKPGMSRDDLIEMNESIIKTVGEKIANYSPGAFVIVITNPLDSMAMAMKRATGFLPNMVVGMAGVLDSSRFKCFLSEEMGVSVRDINAMVLGSHGDTMVPIVDFCSVAGIPLRSMIDAGLITKKRLDEIIARTRDGGAEIVKLLEKGSAYYAPAASAIEMAESYLYDSKRLLPATAFLNGEYGYKNVYTGVPVIIGSGGVEKIIDIKINKDEKAMFDESVASIMAMNNKLKF